MKIGVIGCGGIGKVHIENYKRCKDVEVVAVCDVDKNVAEETTKKFEIPKTFSNYKELLKLNEIDAVSVCLPTFLHAPVTISALNSGKHVLCEKPPAMNSQEVKEMISASKKSKKRLMFGFVNRFRADSQTLKKIIQEGALGKIYHSQVYAERRRGIPRLGSWFTQKSKSGGGALSDIGCHALDLNLWLMNFPQPLTVSAATYTKFGNRKEYIYVSMWGKPVPGGKFDVDDLATAFIRFKDGSTMMLEVSWAANIKEGGFYSVLMGEKAGAKIDANANLEIYGELHKKIVNITPQYASTDIFLCEIQHFVECVKNNKEPLCSAEQGLVVQKIIDGIYKSAELGREVKI